MNYESPQMLLYHHCDFSSKKPRKLSHSFIHYTIKEKWIWALYWKITMKEVWDHRNFILNKIKTKLRNNKMWISLQWISISESLPCFNWLRAAGHLTSASFYAWHWTEPLLGECFVLDQWFRITLWLRVRIIYFLFTLEINFRLWIFTYHLQIK